MELNGSYVSKVYLSFSMHESLRERGLTVFGAMLSFVSTLIGAGIVSLPYAMLQAGTFYGPLLHIGMIIFLLIAVYLYLKTKDNLKYE
jgi:amino acid permease